MCNDNHVSSGPYHHISRDWYSIFCQTLKSTLQYTIGKFININLKYNAVSNSKTFGKLLFTGIIVIINGENTKVQSYQIILIFCLFFYFSSFYEQYDQWCLLFECKFCVEISWDCNELMMTMWISENCFLAIWRLQS